MATMAALSPENLGSGKKTFLALAAFLKALFAETPPAKTIDLVSGCCL